MCVYIHTLEGTTEAEEIEIVKELEDGKIIAIAIEVEKTVVSVEASTSFRTISALDDRFVEARLCAELLHFFCFLCRIVPCSGSVNVKRFRCRMQSCTAPPPPPLSVGMQRFSAIVLRKYS